MKRTFIDIAKNDLQYLNATIGDKPFFYNQNAVNAQQVTEKFLKGYLEKCVDGILDISEISILMKTHNLRKLGEAVMKINPHFKLHLKDLSYLKDFYFEARYPGDNYIDVSKEARDECLAIMKAVICELGYEESVKKLDAF